MEYLTDTSDSHELEEEMQWAKIMSSGHTPAGMALVFIQKLCTAFHEMKPAYDAGALRDDHLCFFKERMANRIRKVLTVLQTNKLSAIDGFAELQSILHETETAGSLKTLASLAEPVHKVNHRLCDAFVILSKLK